MRRILPLLILLSSGAFANDCKKDAERLCGGIEPGKNQLFQCLSSQEAQLSSACRKELREFRTKTQAKNPCFSDLADHCPDISPRYAHYCLLKNEARLSESCSKDLKSKKGTIMVKDQCALDIVNTCYKAVSEPEGAITKCLLRNKPKLSKFCLNNVNKIEANARKSNPCFDDQEKFCPTQVRFMDIHECLVKKLPALTPQCKGIVGAEEKKAKENPCYKDLLTHCRPGLSPNAQVQCLTVNDKHLTSACRKYRTVMDAKVGNMVEACDADRKKLCPKAPLRDGMVLKCLREKKTEVSPACRNLI